MHLPGDFLELLLEEEFCILNYALLDLALGVEGDGFVH
jgi:hypothetical protein